MFRALHTAATGMDAQQTQIDVIAHNLANVNTTGFKKSRGEFHDLFSQQLRGASQGEPGRAGNPLGVEIGQGVRVGGTHKLFTQGASIQTGGKFDLAIKGDGFFKLARTEGEAYSRSGNFTADAEGYLVNADGLRLEPQIQVPEGVTDVVVEANGQVKGKRPNETEWNTLGELKLYAFNNPAGMKSLGDQLYQPTSASGQPVEGTPGTGGLGAIAQKELEASNVQVVEEMIDLIAAQRAYEVNSKVIQATDQMLQETARLR